MVLQIVFLKLSIKDDSIHCRNGGAEMIRPGYAIEYDFADPTQLYHSLETKKLKTSFCRSTNDTTGYEEASAQGFVAGVNAACKVLGEPEFIEPK